MMRSKDITKITSVHYSICIFLGIIINSFVIIIILKNKKLQTTTNFFIFNLAIADLLFTVFGISAIFYKGFAKTLSKENSICVVIGFFTLLFLTTSIWTLVMISINRYLNVAKANIIKTLYTRKKTVLIIGSVWIFSVIISAPPLIGWSEFKSTSSFCTINGKKNISYTVFLGLLVYIIPMVFLASLYMRIFFLLNKVEKKKLRRSINSIKIADTANKIKNSDEAPVELINYQDIKKSLSISDKKVLNYYNKYKNKDSTEKDNEKVFTVNYLGIPRLNIKDNQQIFAIKNHFKEVRITKRLMVLVLGFFFCWTPIFVGAILYSFNVDLKKPYLTTVGAMWVCLSTTLNPLIYSAMNTSFRKYFGQIWKNMVKPIKCW
ncbi:alpha-1B adrenergic receptor [Hydra vulgaris]|uniref:alpha-1B adrenergic receptor n=1 Tax=Hydra vulgaris TaxID=6087 RepID=UPI0006413091|nr:alpha-1B adrenergic receptor [Hydra vulgaris]